MAITATITSIGRIGQSQMVQVQANFSDGTNKTYDVRLPTDKATIRQVVKADLDQMNQLEGQVANLQSLIGTVLS